MAVVLRKRPQKLTASDCRVRQGSDLDQAKKWIGYLLLQGGAQLQELIGKLVDLLVRAREMAAFGAGVRDVEGNAARELTLDIEVPLLGISGGIVRKGRRKALTEKKPLKIRIVAGWLNNAARERIA